MGVIRGLLYFEESCAFDRGTAGGAIPWRWEICVVLSYV